MPRLLPQAAVALLVLALPACGRAPSALARPLEAPVLRPRAMAPSATPAPSTPPASAVPVGRLADFAWLAGRWSGSFNGLPLLNSWIGPASGVMTASMQLTDGKRTMMLQLGALTETPQGVRWSFRHFAPDLSNLEGAPAVLDLVRLAPDRADFENPVHGLPKRTSFIRVGEDELRFRSELVNGDQVTVHESVVRRIR